jgi:CheY-like chemotaxis protein
MAKVLVIDDSKTIRMVVKKSILSNPDILTVDEDDILEGENGLDLVAYCTKYTEIEYIFLDVNMPMLKGNEAIDALAASDRLRDSKIILITTEDLTSKLMPRRDKHVVGHIKKPISFDTLPNLLREVVGGIATKEQKEVLYQKELISKSILNYCKTSQISKKQIDPNKIDSLVNKSITNTPIAESEIIPTSINIFDEYKKEMSISINFDQVKFTFVFDATKEDIDNKTSSLFVVEYTLDEIKEYLSNHSEIGLDYSVDEMLDDYFKKFITILRKLGDITNKEYKLFAEKYNFDEIEVIERFFIETLNFFKKLDYSIEDSKIRSYIKNANILRGFQTRISNIKDNPRDAFDAFCDEYQPTYSGSKNYIMSMSNKTSTKHKEYLKYLSSFVVKHKDNTISKATNMIEKINKEKVEFAYRYTVFSLYKDMISNMKKSDIIKQYFSKNMPNKRLYFKTLMEYMIDKTLKDSTSYSKYKDILESMQKEKLNIILLSNKDEDKQSLESNIRKMGKDTELFVFAQNNVLISWLKSNVPSMIFIDSDYEKTQQIPLVSVFKKFDGLDSLSDIIIIADGNKKDINKKLMSKASAFLKRPLDEAKVQKTLAYG